MITTSVSIHTPGLNAEEKAAVASIEKFVQRHGYNHEHRMGTEEFCMSFGLPSAMGLPEFSTLISRIGRATVSVRVVDSSRAPSTVLLAGSFGLFESIFLAAGEVTFCVSRYISEDFAGRVR